MAAGKSSHLARNSILEHRISLFGMSVSHSLIVSFIQALLFSVTALIVYLSTQAHGFPL